MVSAALVALPLASIAHDDFDLSPQGIRATALVGAGVIVALVAIEFFGKKLHKPK